MIDLTPEKFRELGYRAVDLVAEQLPATYESPVQRLSRRKLMVSRGWRI